ncbi:MAG: hypothetical protein O3C40_35355 [Planctomycetota bacterium]|nr:hypothetical protein [Planctomycetota bacterium]
MPIPVACGCGKRFQAKDELAGRKVKCPNCGGVLAISNAVPPLPQPDPPASNPFFDLSAQPSDVNYGNTPGSPSPYAFGAATRRVTPAKKSKTGLIIGLCIGGGVFGVLLLVLVVAVFWSFRSSGDKGTTPLAANYENVEPTGPNTPAPKVAPASKAAGKTSNAVEANPASSAAASTPLTDDECLDAASRFGNAIMDGDIDAAKGFVDFNELLRRVTADVDVSDEVREGINKGFLAQAGNGGFERQIIESLQSGGGYSALRVHHVGNEIRVWMRLNSDDQGLNYQDLIFFRGTTGQPHVSDMYVVATGELLSETIRRMFIPLAASANRNLLQRLTAAESEFVTHADEIQQLMTQLRTQPALALAAYQRLPEVLRKNKSLMLIRVRAAASVDEQAYSAAIIDFRKAFPNDAAVDMLSIDWHFMREEYDKSLAAIDALDRVVGGDPHLNALRANVYLEQGDYERAEAAANNAIEADPALEDAYWTLITAAMAKDDFAAMLERMKLLDSSFEMEWGDLSEIAEYASFVKSPQYQEWLTHLRSK